MVCINKEQAERNHFDKYEALCKKYGVVWNNMSPRFVGETIESMVKKYQEDKHMNNIRLSRWDFLASAFMANNRNSGLTLAEAVCMQKHAARKMIVEYMKKYYYFKES